MALRTSHNLLASRPFTLPLKPQFLSINATPRIFSARRIFSALNCHSLDHQRKLVVEVKEKLEREEKSLPVGKNGRDDEDMILWFLKDRNFSVDEAASKLTRAIKWRQKFRVSELTDDSVRSMAATGKAYIHESLDGHGRPVLVVVASKHFPAVHDPVENEKLCAFLIEKALRKLPPGKEQILGIFDLRGFGPENADLKFLTFIFDVFYYYYPKRLGQVLFVDAPFVFKPIWQLAKPLLKSYASLLTYGTEKILFGLDERTFKVPLMRDRSSSLMTYSAGAVTVG